MSLTDKELSFDQLPAAVAVLLEKVEILTDLVKNKYEAGASAPAKEWLSVDELCEYLPDRPSKQTVYGWVCHKQIPYHKKTKKLAFLKSEIDEWVAKSRHQTNEEIYEEAINAYNARKGGKK